MQLISVSLNSDNQPTPGNVGNGGSVAVVPVLCVNKGGAFKLCRWLLSFKNYSRFRLLAVILNFGIQPTSVYVDSVSSKSDFDEPESD